MGSSNPFLRFLALKTKIKGVFNELYHCYGNAYGQKIITFHSATIGHFIRLLITEQLKLLLLQNDQSIRAGK